MYVQPNDLLHFGIKRKSGRYPYGSGDRPFQDRIRERRRSKANTRRDLKLIAAESLGVDMNKWTRKVEAKTEKKFEKLDKKIAKQEAKSDAASEKAMRKQTSFFASENSKRKANNAAFKAQQKIGLTNLKAYDTFQLLEELYIMADNGDIKLTSIDKELYKKGVTYYYTYLGYKDKMDDAILNKKVRV